MSTSNALTSIKTYAGTGPLSAIVMDKGETTRPVPVDVSYNGRTLPNGRKLYIQDIQDHIDLGRFEDTYILPDQQPASSLFDSDGGIVDFTIRSTVGIDYLNSASLIFTLTNGSGSYTLAHEPNFLKMDRVELYIGSELVKTVHGVVAYIEYITHSKRDAMEARSEFTNTATSGAAAATIGTSASDTCWIPLDSMFKDFGDIYLPAFNQKGFRLRFHMKALSTWGTQNSAAATSATTSGWELHIRHSTILNGNQKAAIDALHASGKMVYNFIGRQYTRAAVAHTSGTETYYNIPSAALSPMVVSWIRDQVWSSTYLSTFKTMTNCWLRDASSQIYGGDRTTGEKLQYNAAILLETLGAGTAEIYPIFFTQNPREVLSRGVVSGVQQIDNKWALIYTPSATDASDYIELCVYTYSKLYWNANGNIEIAR
jgi:hypothetical protein